MQLELVAYSTPTLKNNKDFLANTAFEYHSDLNRKKSEKALIVESVKLGIKEKTKIYKVIDSSDEFTDIVGIFALSASKIEVNKNAAIPCAELDLFFLNNKYRKIDIGNNTLGEEVFSMIIALVIEVSKKIGINYLILIPLGQNAKLISFYKNFGFDHIPTKKDWMYLKLSNIKD